MIDDPSGEQARNWLRGRPSGKITRLAQKYGKAEDLKLLSIYAHSDVRGLTPLLTGPPHEKDGVDLRPNRYDDSAAPLLHAIAYESVFMCTYLATAFHLELQLPAWIEGELTRLRDAITEPNDRYRPTREAAAKQSGSQPS